MAAQFSRTTRSLERDGSALALTLWLLAALLLAAWTGWFVLGRVNVYEISRSARLEVQQSAHPLAALQAGRLTENHMALGQSVQAGQLLAALDSEREALHLQEEQSRLDAFAPRMESLRREITALQQAQAQERQGAEAALRAARFRAQEAGAGADFANDNARRLKEDSQAGGAAQSDALRAAADARKQASAHDALSADALRLESDARTRQSQQQAQIESLQRALVTLDGERATSASTLVRLRQDIAQLQLRAPVDGVLAEVATLPIGAYVAAGQKLATVLPRGGLVIVADYPPAAVLGRIHAGQKAHMRLDGFPWTEFGSLEAEVSLVASEIRDQTVRVELRPLPSANSRVLLQHGLPGVVEISLEQTSPAQLLLRALGQVSADGLLAAADSQQTGAASKKPAP